MSNAWRYRYGPNGFNNFGGDAQTTPVQPSDPNLPVIPPSGTSTGTGDSGGFLAVLVPRRVRLSIARYRRKQYGLPRSRNRRRNLDARHGPRSTESGITGQVVDDVNDEPLNDGTLDDGPAPVTITFNPGQTFAVTETTDVGDVLGNVVATGSPDIEFGTPDQRFAVSSTGELSVADYELFTDTDYLSYTVLVTAWVGGTLKSEDVTVNFPDGAMFDENGSMVVGPDDRPIYVVV